MQGDHCVTEVIEPVRELVVESLFESLEIVDSFVDEMYSSIGASQSARKQLRVAAEEIFVNIVNYAYGDGHGKVAISGKKLANPPGVELVFVDEGVPFNPLLSDSPDFDIDPDEREIGGLGIYMVKQAVDDIGYEYRDGKNILTIRKLVA